MTDMLIPGTAIPGHVLAGDTFSAGTNYNAAGTMPNRSAQTQGATSAVADGSGDITLQPLFGYYDGASNSLVKGFDANFIAANIMSGKSIFGLAGSYDAKRYATGTGTTVATAGQPLFANGTAVANCSAVSVTGLAFKPRVIATFSGDWMEPGSFYDDDQIIWTGTTKFVLFMRQDANNGGVKSDIGGALVMSSNGFTIIYPQNPNTAIRWIAFE